MKNLLYLFLSLLTVACTSTSPTFNQADISLVPKPSEFQLNEASFKFDATSTISIDNDEQQMAANYLVDLFKKAAGTVITIEFTLSSFTKDFKVFRTSADNSSEDKSLAKFELK